MVCKGYCLCLHTEVDCPNTVLSSPGSRLGQGQCVLSLGQALYYHSSTLGGGGGGGRGVEMPLVK